ncbi:hypothetical protein [Wolbachia endosymbiont (group A) of Anomoia purmunda]|uniref:hypothetical protein n=1 Tax=Wolbachia endosymbiont (group A) of Anomoia purmunda TaxID=2953978 RepID=UPI00222E95D2|nr:hypothetical protein [Wolbachia endosymbiont (group A) of Anomoia purmunda]
MMNKNNVPYYIAGTLATFTLLASGVFAAAPYIGFLAPVAALSVGLPFIIGYAVFSVVTIALSAVVISKNKTISKKDAQLADQAKEIEGKDKTIFEKEAQLAEKSTDISNLRDQLDEEKVEVQAQKRKNSEKEKEIKDKDKADKIISEKNLEISRIKNELAATTRINASQPGNVVEFDSINQQLTKRDVEVQTQEQAIISQAKGAPSSVGNGMENAYGTSVEYVKGKFNSVRNKFKNVYDTMPSTESVKGTISSAGNKLKNVTDIYDLSKAVDSARNRLKHVEAYTACEEVGTTVKEAYSSGRIFILLSVA